VTPPTLLSGRRIAVLKPDFGVVGGFERVIDHIEARLVRDGHDVTRVGVDLPHLPLRPYGAAVPAEVLAAAPDYVRYLAAIEAFEALPLRSYDAVISTQPPSFTSAHPHHLSLFFHHHRIFYDLEDLWIAAGFAPDVALHRQAGERIRALDRPRLDAVRWFAAGSETVRRRLGRFGGIDRVSLFHAGRVIGADRSPEPPGPKGGGGTGRDGPVLSVGRLEFPKRPELVVAALRRLPEVRAVLVGTGGRTEWVRSVDHRLARPGIDLDAVDERALWCCRAEPDEPAPPGWASNVTLAGHVDDATLEHLYATTPCVVAPALDEDYGLTAVEAMAHGAPVIVCDDGGGLADLVSHEVDGLVVAPTGAALAAAIERILGDRELADALSAGALARATATTWDRADDELRLALAIALEADEPPAASRVAHLLSEAR